MKGLKYFTEKRITVTEKWTALHNEMVGKVDAEFFTHDKLAIKDEYAKITKPLSSAINALDVICCKLANKNSQMPEKIFNGYVKIAEAV